MSTLVGSPRVITSYAVSLTKARRPSVSSMRTEIEVGVAGIDGVERVRNPEVDGDPAGIRNDLFADEFRGAIGVGSVDEAHGHHRARTQWDALAVGNRAAHGWPTSEDRQKDQDQGDPASCEQYGLVLAATHARHSSLNPTGSGPDRVSPHRFRRCRNRKRFPRLTSIDRLDTYRGHTSGVTANRSMRNWTHQQERIRRGRAGGI